MTTPLNDPTTPSHSSVLYSANIERPSKRQKTHACLRCRKRKQKCDNQRPCANCTRSDAQCFEAPSAYDTRPTASPKAFASSDPLTWFGSVASLEERLLHLERGQHFLENVHLQRPTSNTTGSTINDEHPATLPPIIESGSLTRCSPAIGLISAFACPAGESSSLADPPGPSESRSLRDRRSSELSLDMEEENMLFEVYHEKVHCRYPFLRLAELRHEDERAPELHNSFFINMVFAIGLLLDTNPQRIPVRHNQQDFYRLAVTNHLSHVFAQPERLSHIQAYLLLAIHSIYSPSTERIISIVSSTMRYCVMAQLHSATAEPEAIDPATKVAIQMRRRVFWCAYALDRTVSAVFDLPSSIPDSQITVKLYANINDDELEGRCAEAFPHDPRNRTGFTDMSAGLHVVYCRQIQSEILNNTLHRDFSKHIERHHHWRLRVLEKLDRWKSLCHRYSDEASSNFTSNDWLHMIYNYSLAMLFQPNKSTVVGPAGEWTIKACVQACLIFRRFRRETPITELWLGLIAQFKCGVALLYCFYATPPTLRSSVYEMPEVFEAIRACSITLSLLAERWPQAKPLRDTFDILAREIPLFEAKARLIGSAAKRMRCDSADNITFSMSQLETLVVHRDTLRMIKEMTTEDFPGSISACSDAGGAVQQQQKLTAPLNARVEEEEGQSPLWSTGLTEEFFQPFTPGFAQVGLEDFSADHFEDVTIGFPGGFDFELPF